jgi:hypothetical protein
MKDVDSFFLPLVEELIKLARGVKAFDALTSKYFALHAFNILAYGDIQAVSKMMKMKGVNGLCPCRFCNIVGIQQPNSRNKAHYVPISRPGGEDYDPRALPLRTPEQFKRHAMEVVTAATPTIEENLAKKYGIKGVSVLSLVPGMTLPTSFPPDFMHAGYENLMKQLVALWTADYKHLDQGAEEYKLAPSVIKAVSDGIAASGSTLPSAYGCRVPRIDTENYQFTAEALSIFSMLLGIPLLHRRFEKEVYFNHFVKLVTAFSICLMMEAGKEEIDYLETLFINWVEEFERYVIDSQFQSQTRSK